MNAATTGNQAPREPVRDGFARLLGGAGFLIAIIAVVLWWVRPCSCGEERDGRETVFYENPCDSVTTPPPEMVLAFTGDSTFEHEIHDCQRLVVWNPTAQTADSLEFGPLVGLFPIDAAMQLRNRGNFADGVAVATIFNWGGWDFEDDPQPYDPLLIEPGWSCLWLRSQGMEWQAAIAPVDTSCVGLPAPAHLLWTRYDVELSAVALRPPGPIVVDSIDVPVNPLGDLSGLIPPTARWGWDPESQTHYIGIKCAIGWCNVLVPGARPSRLTDAVGAHLAVPGWFDEEHLAVFDDDGRLVPGPMVGIYPDSTAWSTRDDGDMRTTFFSSGERSVAVMAVYSQDAEQLGDYMGKWDLDLNTMPDSVFIFVRLAGDGGAANYRRTPAAAGKPAGLRKYSNTLHASIGAVRWRWLDSDQQEWVSCDRTSCCDVGPLP